MNGAPTADGRPITPLTWPFAAVLVVTALGAWGARHLGRNAAEQSAAWLGVGLSACAGGFSLILKRAALARGIRYALGTTGVTFILRLLLLLVGTVWVRSHGGAVTAFAVGFLVVFGALQWLEIGYVAVAAKGRS